MIIKRILLTGGTGLLGVAIQKTAPEDVKGYSIYFPKRILPINLPFVIRTADISDWQEMRSIFKWSNPDVVIHTAGIGNVDYVERHREEAQRINVDGTRYIVDLCEMYGAKLIYVSSNAVFDGKKPLYLETDQVNPINCYGMMKVKSENIVRKARIDWSIVRPILMYGWQYPGERNNPMTWWVDSLEKEAPINIVDDVFSKPLSALECAKVIWKIISEQKTGLYHVAGKDHVSIYKFALHVAEVFKLNTNLINPVSSHYLTGLTVRPTDTSFDTTKMEKELCIDPISIKEGLEVMKKEKDNYFNERR